MTNTVRLCQILGGLRNRSLNMTQLRWEIIPTWLHGNKEVGTKKSSQISLNKEGIQGPRNQRSDLIEAKHKCKILYDEHTEITGEGKKPIPPGQQVRQRLQFEGLEEDDNRLDHSSGWRFYPSSRTTHSSSSSQWQPSSDWKSTWSLDSWQASSWTEQ